MSIFVPCIVLWPKDVAAVGARGIGVAGVGAARMQHASTQCASTPVPHEPPRPAHAHKSTCAGSGPMRTALCCFHRAHRNTMRGSYTGAGIHGHWPAPNPSRKPTPACMHKHGKSARVRWPRAPIGGVCAHTGDRVTWVRRGTVPSVKMTLMSRACSAVALQCFAFSQATFHKGTREILLNPAFSVQNSLVRASSSLLLYLAQVNPAGTEFTRLPYTVLKRKPLSGFAVANSTVA